MTIKTEVLEVDRAKAKELYRSYKAHQHYSQPIDREIARTYQLIAQGRVVIRALASIAAAGVNERNFPKLAIMRADAQTCHFSPRQGGGCVFAMNRWTGNKQTRRYVRMPEQSFPWRTWQEQPSEAEAMVPLIPIHLRPKRGLANYHILFEAEWRPMPPTDPILLRRIGAGDMWVVLAAWDLTDVEKAALAARIQG